MNQLATHARSLAIAAIVIAHSSCSDRNVSVVDRQREKLASKQSVERKTAAGYLVRICCPLAEDPISLGPPMPRTSDGPSACGAVVDILRSNRDPVVLEGVFEEGWYPECIEDIPAAVLLGVLREAPPPRLRSEIIDRLSNYEPTGEIVEAFVDELRREPGDLPLPLHERVASYLSDLGEHQLPLVVDVLRSDKSVTARRGAAEALRLAATDPLALPALEGALAAAAEDSDPLVRQRAGLALAAHRESEQRSPQAALDALTQRAKNDPGAIQRLGTRQLSCASPTAATTLQELTASPNYWNQFAAKSALAARAALCSNARSH